MIRTRLHLKANGRALLVGLVLAGMSAAPRAAWGQSSAVWSPYQATTGNIYYNGGNVGIGTTNPVQILHTRVASGDSIWRMDTATKAAGVVRLLDATGDVSIQTSSSWNALYLKDNGNVGIGTSAPAARLHVYGTSTFTPVTIGNSHGTLDFSAYVHSNGMGYNDISSNAYLTPSPLSWNLRNPSYEGWVTRIGRVTTDNSGAWEIYHLNAVTGSPTPYLTITGAGKVGIGTESPQHRLQVAGDIGAQEVLVTSTGADYVFQPGYSLRPLSEVASYIQAHHHLPDIPSADEFKQKGMGVGEMQVKLLAKIEELTLHMIQADARNDRLEKQNLELRERIARLEEAPTPGLTTTEAK